MAGESKWLLFTYVHIKRSLYIASAMTARESWTSEERYLTMVEVATEKPIHRFTDKK